MIRILFVCLGNICRSPMAEAVFIQMVQQAGLEDRIEVDSAGTGDWHVGAPPHRGTLEILRQNGIPTNSRARQIEVADLKAFDYLIVMDAKNKRDVQQLGPTNAHVMRLLDLLPDAAERDVPDPYYTGDFATTYKLVHQGCEQLLSEIRQRHGF